MDVSIIIVNYNTFSLTRDCIQSIYEKTCTMQFEIILVDNGSTEVNPSEFKKVFPDVILIANPVNEGFGRANNRAMAVARGKYFLLLNSDTYLLNNAVDVAFKFAVEHKEQYSVFGAALKNEDLSDQKSHYTYKRMSPTNAFMHSFIFENILFNKLYMLTRKFRKENLANDRIGGLYGAYIFIDSKVYKELGGFDPDFFMYCEDTEWFRNRIARKFNIAICREAKVVHLGGRSSTEAPVKKQNVLSYYLYWYKLGYLSYTVYVLCSYATVVLNFFLLPLLSQQERRRHWSVIRYRALCLKKVLFDVPAHSNRYDSRRKPLKFDDLGARPAKAGLLTDVDAGTQTF